LTGFEYDLMMIQKRFTFYWATLYTSDVVYVTVITTSPYWRCTYCEQTGVELTCRNIKKSRVMWLFADRVFWLVNNCHTQRVSSVGQPFTTLHCWNACCTQF